MKHENGFANAGGGTGISAMRSIQRLAARSATITSVAWRQLVSTWAQLTGVRLAPAPLACAACLCDPPDAAAASCQLPLGLSAHAATCAVAAPDTVETAFAAPDGWDGACTAVNAIPAGQDCGGQPCVQSLSVEAPTVLVTAACTPRGDEPPPPARLDPWQTRALACLPGAYTERPGDRSTCMPSPEKPGGPRVRRAGRIDPHQLDDAVLRGHAARGRPRQQVGGGRRGGSRRLRAERG
ncbi:hypothetical protein AB3662_20805 [Sorangium cellulosum]|uniref:hypothetical protein n=1 Tax=Sorangium cellulosum TaxID=56 RepID=UPI003D9A34A8